MVSKKWEAWFDLGLKSGVHYLKNEGFLHDFLFFAVWPRQRGKSLKMQIFAELSRIFDIFGQKTQKKFGNDVIMAP